MEQQLKQRLIGAVVLVSLAVIFIPVILEGPEDQWAPRTHEIPASPELDYRASMNLPLPDSSRQDVTPAPDSPDRQSGTGVSASDSETEKPSAAVDHSVSARTAQPTEAPPASTPTASAGPPAAAARPGQATAGVASATAPKPGWYAQLGSFGQQSNAASLRDTLTKAGFTIHLQHVVTGRGTSYRVLAGPEPDRARAESLLRKVGKQMKTTGIVIEIGPGG